MKLSSKNRNFQFTFGGDIDLKILTHVKNLDEEAAE